MEDESALYHLQSGDDDLVERYQGMEAAAEEATVEHTLKGRFDAWIATAGAGRHKDMKNRYTFDPLNRRIVVACPVCDVEQAVYEKAHGGFDVASYKKHFQACRGGV
jgi:hypothetical protein